RDGRRIPARLLDADLRVERPRLVAKGHPGRQRSLARQHPGVADDLAAATLQLPVAAAHTIRAAAAPPAAGGSHRRRAAAAGGIGERARPGKRQYGLIGSTGEMAIVATAGTTRVVLAGEGRLTVGFRWLVAAMCLTTAADLLLHATARASLPAGWVE